MAIAPEPQEVAPLAERIATNVRILLAKRGGLPQKALATVLDTDEGSISKFMNGRREWSADDLDRLGHFFDVHPGVFYDDPDKLFDPGSRTGSNRNGWGLIVNPEPDQAEDHTPSVLTLVR